jgi:hypothetical protein
MKDEIRRRNDVKINICEVINEKKGKLMYCEWKNLK